MQDRCQQLQDKYFQEYKVLCLNDSEFVARENNKWDRGDAIIFDCDLNQKAEYADYVTRKMCEEQTNDVIIWMCKTSFYDPKSEIMPLGSCAIGNLALYLKHLLAIEGNEELKQQIQTRFNQIVEKQKQLSNNPECCLQ